MQIGDYKVYSLVTGLFKLDGGAMFGVVPKPLWSKTNPADEQNRIEMCTRSLFLDNGKRKIIVDTGTGHKLSKKNKEIYSVDFSEHSLEKSLEKLDISSDDITDVILTHLHFDHCGGSTYYDKNDGLKVTFPNATHYVQEKHLEWASNPTERDRASFFENDFKPLIDKKLLKTFNGETRFDDFISLRIVNGHTPYMQVVTVSDNHNNILYGADLIPMASHIQLPYIMGYDLLPLVTLNEKRYFLNQIIEKNGIVFLEHDPYVEGARISFNGKQFFLQEKIFF